MNPSSIPHISLVIPFLNEEKGLAHFHASLVKTLDQIKGYDFEIIYCDDGSKDTSREIITKLCRNDPRVQLLVLSRNFGKEYALTAGFQQASGDAIISIDSDGQHPVELIPDFIKAWEAGSQVVVGVRNADRKHRRSSLFYSLFNKVSGDALIDGSTDFRLIDHIVKEAFLQLEEGGRITRGLIDWLGFERTVIPFDVKNRSYGQPSYSTKKLIQLAMHSFVSFSNVPLYVFGVVGTAITALSSVLGIAIIIEQLIVGDPLHWKFTGTAMLGILILFLVGIVLMSQGILSVYVSAIYRENKRRPLYVINHKHSITKKR